MNRVRVGLGSCGLAAGGRAVHAALARALTDLGVEAELSAVGCLGLCHHEVLVELESDALGSCLYGEVTAADAPSLLSSYFHERDIKLDRLILRNFSEGPAAALWRRQTRIALARTGRIDPESLAAYRAVGGYQALARALLELGPEEVVAAIAEAGLRGRGGGGFPTATKWALARRTAAADRVVVCNGDEGDPGAFMDRNLLEGDPFAVLEGMTLCAYAVGARRGYAYVRDEYPLAVERFEHAVRAARDAGLLGERILGSAHAFDVQVMRGAGAFVCGEETALIASLSGQRGIPRRRPPYPAESGLDGLPTVINNVETFANVTWIVQHGAAAFARHGTATSRGTKVFALAGDVRYGGMVETPMGLTLAELVHDLGGGSKSGRAIKAIQIGGPAGGCVPAAQFDVPVDYESLSAAGAIMGSGGLIALDESACMVDIARYFLAFTQAESCGQCGACRVGTKRMLEILERLCEGGGRTGDLERLEQLAEHVARTSLCGLGRAAPNPVLTTLRHFRGEYRAHLEARCCPAGKCRALVHYRIDACRCDGCTLCLDQCAQGAIGPTGRGIALAIDPEPCVRCGGCFAVCRFGAVVAR